MTPEQQRTNWILGISAYYHDSAACLLRGGEIFAAAQQERFTRKKHEQSYCWQHQLGPGEKLPAGPSRSMWSG